MFKAIEIENFMSIRHLVLPLEDLGLVLIEGPNGAGKSSIFEALFWCLYEKTVRGHSKDQVISKGAKFCSVTLLLITKENKQIYVKRTRKHPKLGNSFFIEDTQISQGKSGERDAIKSLMGLDSNGFLYTVLMGQSSSRVLGSASDKDQKALYETILIPEGLQNYQAKVGIDLDELKRRREQLDLELKSYLDQKDNIEAKIEQIRPLFEDYNLKRDLEIQCIKESNEKKTRLIGLLNGRRRQAEEDFKKIQEEETRLINLCSELVSKQKEVEKEEAALRIKETEQRSKWEAKKNEAESNLQSLVSQEQSVLENKDSRCPKCFSKITEKTKKAHLEHIFELIQKAKEKCKEFESGFVFSEINALSNLIVSISSIYEKHKTTNAELSNIQSQVAIWKQNFEKIDKDVEALQHQISLDEGTMKHLQENNNPHDYSNLSSQLIELDTKLSDLPKHMEKCDTDLSYLNFIFDMFSDKGLKSYLFDYIVGPLNATAAYYSQILTQNRFTIEFSTVKELKSSGELRDNFNIKVSNADGARDYHGLSGGEKKRVDILILKTVREVLGSRSKFPINLSIFDEFTSDLDVIGRELVFNLIEYEVSEKGTTFLVTHDQELKSKFEFKNRKIISVKKGGDGFSEFSFNF